MKKSLNLLQKVESLRALAAQMGGVFSYADVANVIAAGSPLNNARALRRLVNEGILFHVQRGIYVTTGCDLWVLASRISAQSYISMDSVLAANGLCGTVPARSVSAVHLLRNRTVETPDGSLHFHALAKKLFFGTSMLSSGVCVADSEKAFIDLLYYYVKGARFVIDPVREINVRALNRQKLESYLKRYENQKFVTFVKGVAYEK